MDDSCGEWVECMGVASGCGEQEVGVASGSGWNKMVLFKMCDSVPSAIFQRL